MVRKRLLEEDGVSTASQKNVDLQVTNTFYRNFNSTAKIVVNRGGRGSSKSYSLMQLIVLRFLSEKNKNIFIGRKSLPPLRISTLLLFKDIISKLGVADRIKEEKVFLNYTYKVPGTDYTNLIHFGSIDDAEKIKSSSWNYIWLEEATEFSYEDFTQCKLRIDRESEDGRKNQLFLSFNPIDEHHWIKERVVDPEGGEEDMEEIVSTYVDNPFLATDVVQALHALAKQDIGFYRIYTLGEWGRLENIIYRNWDKVKSIDPEGCKVFYGLDFGFNAETALVKCFSKGREVWLEQVLYKTGMTNSNLIDFLKEYMPNVTQRENAIIYCDSAAPDRIKELNDAGFKRAKAIKKKPIKDGIDFVKSLMLHVLEDSVGIIKELQMYSWKTNKEGDPIDEPIQVEDHTLDAIRYAINSHLNKANVGLRWL